MRDLIDDRVTLLGAHQLSTVVPADLIVVPSRGWIKARDSQAVIPESSPTHRRLHDRQFAAASG